MIGMGIGIGTSFVRGRGAAPVTHSPLYTHLLEFWALAEASGAALGDFAEQDLAAVNSPGAAATGSPRGGQCRAYAGGQYHDGPVTNPGGSATTLWCWVRPTAGAQLMQLYADGDPARILGCEWESGTLYVYFRDSAGTTRNTTTAMTGSAWHLVALVWDGATGLCYFSVDGAARTQISTALSNPLAAWDRMSVGGYPFYNPGNSREWAAGLTAYAATDDDLAALWNSGAGLTLSELEALTA